MKWETRSCEAPRKSSASEALPSSVSNRYSLPIRTHGSSCRHRASSSLRRVSSFSALSSSRRAASQSWCETILCLSMLVLSRPDVETLAGFEEALQAREHARPAIGDAALHFRSRLELVVRYGEAHHVLHALDVEGDAAVLLLVRRVVGRRPAYDQAPRRRGFEHFAHDAHLRARLVDVFPGRADLPVRHVVVHPVLARDLPLRDRLD